MPGWRGIRTKVELESDAVEQMQEILTAELNILEQAARAHFGDELSDSATEWARNFSKMARTSDGRAVASEPIPPVVFLLISECREWIHDWRQPATAVLYLRKVAVELGALIAKKNIPTASMNEILSLIGKRAANARHEGNREKGEKIVAWATENLHKYSSLDKTAEVAAQIFHTSFRTARKYVGKANGLRFARRV